MGFIWCLLLCTLWIDQVYSLPGKYFNSYDFFPILWGLEVNKVTE